MGFTIESAKLTGMILVFALYSLAIIAVAFVVKWNSRKAVPSEALNDFFNGGKKKTSAFTIAMIMCTASLSSGAMIGGPSTGYKSGFIWTFAVFAGFFGGMFGTVPVGKKFAIVAKRLGRTSPMELLRHRYSKTASIAIACMMLIFITTKTIGEFSAGAKMFAAITGTGNFHLGLAIFGIVTLLYTLCGGLKSVKRIAAIQGVIMMISVLAVFIYTLVAVRAEYGNVENALRFVSSVNSTLVNVNTWKPMYVFGMGLLMGFSVSTFPGTLMTAATNSDTPSMRRSVILSTITMSVILFFSIIGPLAFALNPELATSDYVTFYLASNYVPTVFAGLLVAGCAAAIQSSLGAYLLCGVTYLVKDVFRSLKPEITDEKAVKMTNITLVAYVVFVLALCLDSSNTMVQMFTNYANGGFICSMYAALILGMYWKRMTPAGGMCASVLGVITYIVLHEANGSAAYTALFADIHPVVLGLIFSLLIGVVVSLFTKQTELGRLQVWFSSDYDEKYTKLP